MEVLAFTRKEKLDSLSASANIYVASIPVSCAARLMVSTSQRGTRLEPNETISVRLSPRGAGFRGSARGHTLPAVSNAAASAAAAQLSLSIRTPTPSVEHALSGSAGQPRSAGDVTAKLRARAETHRRQARTPI